MRGTGSHTVKLESVFVLASAIVLRRPRGTYATVWNLVVTVALPLIMSVYAGVAQKAAQMAINHAKKKEQVQARKFHISSGK